MRITDSQKVILEGLTCERLSNSPDNMRLIDNFFNRRNPSLVQTLQNEAMAEDQEGKVAYYIVMFLFAADLSENDSLIGYYRDRLDFMRDEERATVKPIYDLSCEFMYQECGDIEERCSLFFDNFNLDQEEI